MATAPVKTANDWLKVLTHAGKKTADEVPPGFKTIEQISKETGKSSTMVRRQLNEAVKLGLVERQKFNVPTGYKLYPVPHFRILPCNSQKRSA
jgi:DNA-binding HxlR family transcriptional regulator